MPRTKDNTFIWATESCCCCVCKCSQNVVFSFCHFLLWCCLICIWVERMSFMCTVSVRSGKHIAHIYGRKVTPLQSEMFNVLITGPIHTPSMCEITPSLWPMACHSDVGTKTENRESQTVNTQNKQSPAHWVRLYFLSTQEAQDKYKSIDK